MTAWTGNHRINSLLHRLCTAYEVAFPGCKLSYYLIGSWAEGESNALSDIDVVVVWTHGAPTKDDRARGEQILQSISSTIRLDTFMVAEEDVPDSLIGVNLKLSSKHLYGPDIRESLPLPPLDTYTQSVTQGAHFFITQILRGVEDVAEIDYPDPDDELFGYARKRIDAWYPAEVTLGLKEWVSTATRIARALVAIESSRAASQLWHERA